MAEWNQCWYCGIALTPPRRDLPTTSTIDEMVARSRGNVGGKMVMACKRCNNWKCSSSIEDYRAWLGIEKFYGERMGWLPW